MKSADLDVDARKLAAAVKDYQAAAAILDESLASDPDNADALRTLAHIHRKLGGAYEAQDQLSEAVGEYFKASQVRHR